MPSSKADRDERCKEIFNIQVTGLQQRLATIGANAVIVGNITIGSDVLIAPLAYVNFDVPDHSIVIGNPGKIIPREDATADYVCNRV